MNRRILTLELEANRLTSHEGDKRVIESTEQAVSLLKNERLDEMAREEGVHYLLEYPSEEGTLALVEALQDSDAGVRWSAGAALAQLGDRALVPILEALVKPTSDILLREGTRHVLHYSSSAKVRAETADLMQALKGPGADVTSMEAAGKLLIQVR